MQSLSRQSLVEMGGARSVLARQKRDHVRLGALLELLDEVPARRQDAVLLEIYRLVFPHAFAEEAVLWPLMRRVLADGQQLTLRVELEHQQINELVTELEALEPASSAHRQVLERIVRLLREDVRDEEDDLLPRLQEKLTVGQLRALGFIWEVVRAIAPTRAHPIVSRRPPGNVLSALPLALLDRCRDVLDARVQKGAGVAEPVLAKLGSALTRASHAVERLPVLRRGEDPVTRVSARPNWAFAAFPVIALGSTVLILTSRRR